MTRPATSATPAIIRKNLGLSMLLQKLPSQPAMKLPTKLVASHTPISIDTIRAGATFDTSDNPICERYSSPIVMTPKYPSSHSQLASGPPPDCQAAPPMIRLASATPKQPSD